MKRTAIAALCALLAACNDGGSGESIETVAVNGSNVTTAVSRSTDYNLDINGMKNTVSVADNQRIAAVNLNGSGHTVTIGKGAKIGTMNIVGVSSDITLAAGYVVDKINYSGASVTIRIPAGTALPPATGSGVDLKVVTTTQ